LNSHLMTSCFRNICAKNRQNPLILFKVTIDNVGVPFFETQCIIFHVPHCCSVYKQLPYMSSSCADVCYSRQNGQLSDSVSSIDHKVESRKKRMNDSCTQIQCLKFLFKNVFIRSVGLLTRRCSALDTLCLCAI